MASQESTPKQIYDDEVGEIKLSFAVLPVVQSLYFIKHMLLYYFKQKHYDFISNYLRKATSPVMI